MIAVDSSALIAIFEQQGGRPRLGLIVNPIAGLGGKPGLKGTDGEGMAARARRLGAEPVATPRARRMLLRLAPALHRVDLLTGRGELGEDVAAALGLPHECVGPAIAAETTARDTREVAAALLACGVDLLLFAGGDGTARDVFEIVGDKLPILGVPTGVKMHSAVFATGPETAADVAQRFIERSMLGAGAGEGLREAEIMDIDEVSLRAGRVAARLHGYARIPYERLMVQHAKSAAMRDGEAALDALCRAIAGKLEPGCLYVFGPGTTMQRILRHAGIEGTLLGVDAVMDGRLVGADLGESALLALAEGRKLRIVVGVIGGQGFVFGRGNQQIGAALIGRAGKEGITVVASLEKLLALEEQCLFVDSCDEALDASLAGFIRVETAPDQTVMCRLRKA